MQTERTRRRRSRTTDRSPVVESDPSPQLPARWSSPTSAPVEGFQAEASGAKGESAGPSSRPTTPGSWSVGGPKLSVTPELAGGTQTRLAYSIQESADLLGVNYYSVYRLIQRGRLRVCRALRGKLLVPQSELIRLLGGEE